MAATIGALKFTLAADTAEFERAMKGVESVMRRAAAIGSTVGTVIGEALTGAFHSLTESIKKAIESADRMDELAEMIGLSVEKLSGLRFAADLSGVSLDALTTNLTKLGKAMSESVSEPAGTAARTLQAMGISATGASGQLRPINDVFLDIADKFKTYEDGAGKVTLATNLFGRAGAQMIPLLNQGRDGIAQLSEEAAKLGLSLDTKTIKAAAQFNDTMTKIGRIWDGLIMQLTGKLLPLLQHLADRFAGVAAEGGKVEFTIAAVVNIAKILVAALTVLGTVVESSIITLATLLNALIKLGQFDPKGAFEQLQTGFRGVKESITEAKNALQDLFSSFNAWQTTVTQGAADTPQRMAPIVASANALRDAMREWKDEARAAMDAIVNAPTETFVAKIEAINAALAQGVINQRTYGQMVRKVEEENRQNITSTASLVASTLTTVFGKSKAAAVAAAIINTAVGITNALAKLPPPYSWAQAALIAASGAAQIATIKSSNSNGGGRAPTVSGGGAGEGEGASDAVKQTLMLNINLAPGRYSRDEVVGLIEQINGAVSDGAQLVVSAR
jgi:hypothetical protein